LLNGEIKKNKILYKGLKVSKVREKNLIWLDLEMTGLNIKKDVILEIASVITDNQLQVIKEGPQLVINCSDEKLASMNDEVKNMHTSSGLLQEVRKSKITLRYAEEKTIAFFKKHCKVNKTLLCGNSVWQDKNFLSKYMPSLADFFCYRIIDVTSIKEVVARWYPNNPQVEFKKEDKHRAMFDIYESIEELKHLREYFFIKN